MDWDSFGLLLQTVTAMAYWLMFILVFLGIPVIGLLGLFSCTVLCIAEKRDKKKKVLFGVLSLLSGSTLALYIGMIVYFTTHLANTPITFM